MLRGAQTSLAVVVTVLSACSHPSEPQGKTTYPDSGTMFVRNGSVTIALKNIDVLPSIPEKEFQPPTRPITPHVTAPDPKAKKG